MYAVVMLSFQESQVDLRVLLQLEYKLNDKLTAACRQTEVFPGWLCAPDDL